MDDRVKRLRTPGLKTYREARDAAIFVYGMGLAKSVAMAYTPFEQSDYDFVATWVEESTQHFAPVTAEGAGAGRFEPDGLDRRPTPQGHLSPTQNPDRASCKTQ